MNDRGNLPRSTEVEAQRQSLNEVPVGRIEEPDRKPAALAKHRLAMRQLAKAFFAVIGADARIADAAERQVVLEHMPAPVVERHAAGMRLLQQMAPLGGVEAEA